jgi:hypothetical protein
VPLLISFPENPMGALIVPSRLRLTPIRVLVLIQILALASLVVLSAAAAAANDFATARLTGRVTDAAGNPLAGAKVYFNRLQGARLDQSQHLETRSDKTGHYELSVRFEHGATLFVPEVFVDRAGYIRAAPGVRLSFRDGQELKQDFQLEKGEILSGVIKMPPVPQEIRQRPRPRNQGVLLMVEGPNLEPRPVNARLYQTGADGHFEICLPPGRYKLIALPLWIDYVQTEWPNLHAGQRNLALTLTGRWSVAKNEPLRWKREEAEAAFDQFWSAMDRQYSYFFLKKDVDWNRLKKEFRPQAIAAKTPGELATVLQNMLAPLRDLHVFIRTPDETLPTYVSGYSYNGNARVIRAQLTNPTRCGAMAIVGRTKPDGFGYFLMVEQAHTTRQDVEKAVRAIQSLNDAPGFIVDLRKANGGSEPRALEVAKAFCAKETIYAKSKRRSGPAHTDFAEMSERRLPASPNAYAGPVVCLIGPGAVSSGEAFVQMMRSLPNVTTVGLPTRGASGNPQPFPFPGTNLIVYFSTWVDLLPNAEPFEGVGILPDVLVKTDYSDYIGDDPTLDRGLEVLRKKIESARNAPR